MLYSTVAILDLGVSEEGGCARAVDDLTLINDHSAIRKFQSPAHVLLDEEQRCAFVSKLAEQGSHLLDQERHDAFGGFVQEDHPRLGNHRTRDGKHLLFAARQGRALLAEALFETRKIPRNLVNCLTHFDRDVGGEQTDLKVLSHREPRDDPSFFRYIAKPEMEACVRREGLQVMAAEFIRPVTLGISPMTALRVLVLPAPFLPMSVRIVPCSTVKERPCKT